MKVIFLDVDGVLNTGDYLMHQVIQNNNKANYEFQFNFDPCCLGNLKEIVEKTGAEIVVSSTWRLSRGEEEPHNRHWRELISNLISVRLNILDNTPVMGTARGVEIRRWLENNKHLNIESFVIIDDDADMEEFTETKLAQCRFMSGLTDAVKEKAIKILSEVYTYEDERNDI